MRISSDQFSKFVDDEKWCRFGCRTNLGSFLITVNCDRNLVCCNQIKFNLYENGMDLPGQTDLILAYRLLLSPNTVALHMAKQTSTFKNVIGLDAVMSHRRRYDVVPRSVFAVRGYPYACI